MIRIAMIGAGGYAFELIKRIWTIPDKIKLVAVTSNPARKRPGAETCRQKGVILFDTVDDMLESMQGKCDVIFIPTSIHTHSSLTKTVLEAGFDVFLEKPPTATIQDYDDLVTFVTKRGKKVALCFQYLYTSIMQRMKEQISSGKFGKVKCIRSIGAWERLDNYFSRSGWAGKLRVNDQWVLDGTINNPLAHVLCNNLYLASTDRWKLAEPKTVQAELYHAHNIESEDISSLRIITTDGVEIVYLATLCANKVLEPVTIIECEKATIEYAEFNKAIITYKSRKKEEISDETELRVQMLKELALAYENKKPYYGSLELCRPFTLTVNGAFESSRMTHSVAPRYVQRFEYKDSIKTVVSGLDDSLMAGFKQGKLLSELGVPWAIKTKPFDLAGYTQFPSDAIGN
ncbi:MAG: Gfo/Idh/MocA family oxidoreductase [Sedimentisphaerales bacterium]|nr:Gfo/Idh/MocA family oxidoreductase [Sedimentisphaerales bacterium]